MNNYLSSSGLKSLAKGQLLGNYGNVIFAVLMHYGCILVLNTYSSGLGASNTTVGFTIYLLLTLAISLVDGLFLFGEANMNLKIACNQHVTIQDLYYGFKNDPSSFLKIQIFFSAAYLLISLPTGLALKKIRTATDTEAILIPAIIIVLLFVLELYIRLAFSQWYYMLLDFPEYPAKKLIPAAFKLMKGSKGRLLYINLSFIPLFALGFLSFCVAFLWVIPYYQAVNANFYLDLVKKKTGEP